MKATKAALLRALAEGRLTGFDPPPAPAVDEISGRLRLDVLLPDGPPPELVERLRQPHRCSPPLCSVCACAIVRPMTLAERTGRWAIGTPVIVD